MSVPPPIEQPTLASPAKTRSETFATPEPPVSRPPASQPPVPPSAVEQPASESLRRPPSPPPATGAQPPASPTSLTPSSPQSAKAAVAPQHRHLSMKLRSRRKRRNQRRKGRRSVCLVDPSMFGGCIALILGLVFMMSRGNQSTKSTPERNSTIASNNTNNVPSPNQNDPSTQTRQSSNNNSRQPLRPQARRLRKQQIRLPKTSRYPRTTPISCGCHLAFQNHIRFKCFHQGCKV